MLMRHFLCWSSLKQWFSLLEGALVQKHTSKSEGARTGCAEQSILSETRQHENGYSFLTHRRTNSTDDANFIFLNVEDGMTHNVSVLVKSYPTSFSGI